MLSERRATLDPVALLHSIREAQSALTALTAPELRPTPQGESLEQFLSSLPDQWRRDETHSPRERKLAAPRTWRTRADPFAGVWCDVLGWLQEEPDASAMALLGRLQAAEPDRFSRAQLKRCSGGCNSGAASWRTSWSTQRLKQRCRNSTEGRNWLCLERIPSAKVSVTFLNEATGRQD